MSRPVPNILTSDQRQFSAVARSSSEHFAEISTEGWDRWGRNLWRWVMWSILPPRDSDLNFERFANPLGAERYGLLFRNMSTLG